MISPKDLVDLKTTAPDYAQTDSLKKTLSELRQARDPFYLERADLKPIFEWKLGNQLGRVHTHLQRNTDEAYRAVTEAVFRISSAKDIEYELRTRLALLSALSGVGVGVASAVLALAEPQRYCVIDFRGWRAVFGELKNSFTASDYSRYLRRVTELARDLGWHVQEVDLAAWQFDREKNYKAV